MCDGCDREVTIGELMEFHAENYPEEDQSLREAVLRKMESEEGFDEADDTFLNEVLADYTQKVPMEAPKERAKKVKFWTRIGQRDKNDRRRYETYEITLDASEATHKKKYQEWYLNWEGGVDGYLTFPNCKSCKAKLLNVFNGEGANEKEIEEVWTDGGPVRDYAELDAPETEEMESPKSRLTVEQKETLTIVQKALKDRGADKILYLTYLENKSTRNAFWFGFVYKDGGSTYGGMAFGAYGKMPSVKAESYSSPVFAVLEINTRKRNKIENRSYVPVTESTGRTFKSEDENMEEDEEYEADEEDTVPEEELDVELPQKEEDELEAEVEEAEEEIDEDIEDYDAPDVKDYLKTFAVFAVAASGAIVGIFLTLKGIAAMSQIK